MTDDEIVAAACSRISTLGLAFLFDAEAAETELRVGLPLRGLYLLGRGGMLGNTSAGVVRSVLGYSNPSLIARTWAAGTSVIEASEAARLSWDLCAKYGRKRMADLDCLDGLVRVLSTVSAAANPTGMPIYAAIRDRPLATDPGGQAMQLIYGLREFRAAALLMAIRSVGLDDVHAHFVLAPQNAAFLGWEDSDMRPVTASDRERVSAAQRISGQIVLPAFASLDRSSRDLLVDGLDAAIRATERK